ncbi:CDP-glycerol glycerophosphotransferase family protein [Desulfoplanes sp.]
MRKTRILFHADRSMHVPFLEPIARLLKDRPDMEIGFSAPPCEPVQSDRPGFGLLPREISRLERLAPFYKDPYRFRSDIVVVADMCHFRFTWGPKVVNVGHGMICKGDFYTSSGFARRENLSELICVPGEWHKERLEPIVFSPIEVTGFIKSDRIFGSGGPVRDAFLRSKGIDPCDTIIFFAPTYNPELSAIPCVMERIAELALPGRHLLIKLHDMTDPRWRELYVNLAENHSRVTMLDNEAFAGAMVSTDILVSDVSSVYVESMGLDKPIVLFNNPDRNTSNVFHEDDIEYLVRDAVTEVASVEELKRAVDASLDNPACLSKRRRFYADRLDYGQDGLAAERAADAIVRLVSGEICPRNLEPCLSVIIDVPGDVSPDAVGRFLRHVQRNARERLCIALVGPGLAGLEREDGVLYIPEPEISMITLRTIAKQAEGGKVALLKYGQRLPKGWDRMLLRYFRWHPDAGIVSAICTPEIVDHILSFSVEKAISYKPRQKADMCKYFMEGADNVVSGLPSTCLVVDKLLLEHAGDTVMGWDSILSLLYAQTKMMKREIVVAFNTYVFTE